MSRYSPPLAYWMWRQQQLGYPGAGGGAGLINNSTPGALVGNISGGPYFSARLTNSLKGAVSAGAVLAGGLSLKRALAGNVAGGGVLGGNLTAAASVALDLPFSTMSSGANLTAKSVTFTRSGNAMMYDSTGKLTYAPNNLFTDSQALGSAPWSPDNQQTLTMNAVAAPDGTTTATSSVLTVSANRSIGNMTVNVPVGAKVILSVYAYKPAGSTSQLILEGGFSGGSTTLAVTGAWARYSTVITCTQANDSWRIRNTGNSGDTLYTWGAQLEMVTYQTTPRAYIPTTSAAVYGPRFDYDPVTLTAKGLLIEESRTNVIKSSGDWTSLDWSNISGMTRTANSVLSPDGTTTATTLTAASNNGYVQQQGATTGNVIKTGSFWIKRKTGTGAVRAVDPGALAWIDISSSVTSSWTRVTLPTSATTTDRSIGVQLATAGDEVYVWGAQVEDGSFATSYIPTTSASVTRAAESETVPIPSTVSTIRHTYADNTTADISVSPSSIYTFPVNKTYKLTQSVGA